MLGMINEETKHDLKNYLRHSLQTFTPTSTTTASSSVLEMVKSGSVQISFRTLPPSLMTPGYISSGLVQISVSPTPYVPPSKKDYEITEHLKMEMEIPCSNKIKFITACSFSNDSFEDIMKAQVSVIKASATLNIQAFKIKKSVSISFRMTQSHLMAKDQMIDGKGL
ncbi:hypothetical protein Tco_0969086 [Tanacetum coccineum]